MSRTKKKKISIFGVLNEFDDEQMATKEIVDSLKYHYKNLRKWNPKLYILGILRCLPDLMIPTLAILLPTMVLKGLENKWSAEKYIIYVGTLMIIMLLVNMLNAKIQSILTSQFDQYRFRYLKMLAEKQMDVDYDILESISFQDKKREAFFWIAEWAYGGPVEKSISSPGVLIASGISLLVYGSILAKENVLILIFIGLSVMISLSMSARAIYYDRIFWSESASVRRKIWYIMKHAMNFSEGKDVRLYNMQKWFIEMHRKLIVTFEKHLSKVQHQFFLESATQTIMGFIRDVVAYTYLIYQIVNGRMSVSDFILYTGLVAGFSQWFRKCVEELQNLFRGGNAFYSIRRCLDVENHWKSKSDQETNLAENALSEGVSIELKNVSFYYEEEKPILSHVNLKIAPGERLALVGLNGAGKTTLVKLICGFYQPREGEILVNDKAIFDYDRESYYSMISVVFQDTGILPASILENVSCKMMKHTDHNKAMRCIEKAGLLEKIVNLPTKENTLLVRELANEAIELSGGEKQKLLLARALYKEGKILILDEPTAALDPIAENEVYLRYHELTEDKTSIFISHRLSSTRFCDRIILLDQGQIVEEGSHDELMRMNGQYANMFYLQSQYYEEKLKKQEEGDSLAI